MTEEERPGEKQTDDRLVRPRPARKYSGTIEEMERAIKRLDLLEYLLIGGAMILALIGGAIAAYLITAESDLPFFATWVVVSLVLFVLPGGIAIWSQRQNGRGRK